MYGASVKFIEEPLENIYDRRVDVMSEQWDEKYVLKLMKADPTQMVTDALLDQNKFAGVGNIIKNEVLLRVHTHPESVV